jgi:hypothetical protein
MKTLRQFSVALVALALLLAGTLARAQVLQNVPSDAMVVLKIKNLKDVSDKVALLSQQWGLANMRPELNDPLGTILTMANLGQGIDKSGEAGVAIMDPGNDREPKVLVLIPVTDFKGFAASLPNAKEEGEFTSFSMGGNPQPGYAANWGKFAAVSPTKELLTKKGGGIPLKGPSAKEVESKDIVAYANIIAIRAKVLPLIQQNRQKFLDQIGQAMANQPGQNPKFAPVMKTYLGQFVNGSERFLTDTDAATLGINLSKDGISISLLADFQPGSYLGKLAGQLKNTDASLTAGLPAGKYFVYGGFASDPKTGTQILNDFLAPIEKELQGLGDDGKPVQTYLDAMKEYLAAATQGAFGWVAPPAQAIQQTGLVQVVSIVKGDMTKLQSAQKKLLAATPDMMKVTGAGEMVKSEAKTAAKTVDGVTLDQIKTTFNPDPNNPAAQQMAMMMAILYGPNGMTAYTGAVGDKMLGVAGGNDALLAAAVAAAKSNADPLAEGPGAKLNANLPKSRIAAVYVPVDIIATTVFDFMAMQGMKTGAKLPPNLPPLGATIATESSALRADGYIPAQTVQSLIAAGMQMWLQGMQGGGAGQPGGL